MMVEVRFVPFNVIGVLQLCFVSHPIDPVSHCRSLLAI